MIVRQVLNIVYLIDSLQYISHHNMKRERTANRLTQFQSILASLHLQMINQQLKWRRKLENTPDFMLGTWKLWMFSITTKFQHPNFQNGIMVCHKLIEKFSTSLWVLQLDQIADASLCRWKFEFCLTRLKNLPNIQRRAVGTFPR